MASFSDDFNRADSSNLGAGWVEVSGDWSIISNRLSSGSAGGTIILRAATAMDTADHAVQMTITATAAVSHGVWARGNSNISQGYLFRNDGSSWNIFSVVGGSFTSIGSYAAAAAANDVVKLQVVGTAIKGYINGVLRISVTDSAVTSGTSVGIRAESTSSLRFDDFSAADVTASATLTTASAVEAAQPLAGSKTVTPSIASASETTQPLAGAKSATAGISVASEAAQPLAGAKATAMGSAAASEAAQQVAGSKTAALGLAGVVDTAQPAPGLKAAALGVATVAEEAQPLVGGKTATLGVAMEAATAQLPAGAKVSALPIAAEGDAAPSLGVAGGQSLGTAAAVETALPLTGTKHATLTPALEVDTGRPIAPPSAVVPSPERTFRIPAERRRLAVAAESRRLNVAAERRTLTIRR